MQELDELNGRVLKLLLGIIWEGIYTHNITKLTT
jgi:hypothetical protein